MSVLQGGIILLDDLLELLQLFPALDKRFDTPVFEVMVHASLKYAKVVLLPVAEYAGFFPEVPLGDNPSLVFSDLQDVALSVLGTRATRIPFRLSAALVVHSDNVVLLATGHEGREDVERPVGGIQLGSPAGVHQIWTLVFKIFPHDIAPYLSVAVMVSLNLLLVRLKRSTGE